MKIAIIAPPWLQTYPGCYYGIENVIQNLTSALHRKGHEVVLFGVGGVQPRRLKYIGIIRIRNIKIFTERGMMHCQL